MTEACAIRPVHVPSRPAVGLEPFLSVLVPVRNEAAFLEATLTQLLTQNYPDDRFEVLVADGDSTDGTAGIVLRLMRDHANLRLLRNRARLSSAGRNLAIRAARGEIVVVIDGHCDLDNPNYLTDLAGAFARSGADCVGRPQTLEVAGATALQRAVAVARSSRLGHNPSSFIYSSAERFVEPQSVAVAYRREVFDRVGLFDERFDACEDVELNHRVDRAGMACFFTPRVRVRYHPRASLLGLFRQLARYGRGRVRLLRKHPETLSLPCLLPAGWLLGMLAGPLAAALLPALMPVYLATLALYGLLVGLTSVVLAARARDAGLLPWLPFVFAAIHAGAGYGVLRETLTSWRASTPPELRLLTYDDRRRAAEPRLAFRSGPLARGA